MSKISDYLSEHILGEVTHNRAICERFSIDSSVLQIKPEIIVFPRITNDIRKVARLSWQLAEKGHIVPITPRGFGADATGAAIGKGIIVNTSAHLNQVLLMPINHKHKFVHVQPGVSCANLNMMLSHKGMSIPAMPESARGSTIGGVIANNSRGPLSGLYGGISDWVDRLEVVLANGDIIETGRITKKELSKKIGLQTFEGEIYRRIDGLIEDYDDLIKNDLKEKRYGNIGYAGISDVKQKDGSVDLTPLFIGSQGTLGIISEIIMRTDFMASEFISGVVVFKSFEEARDYADELRKYNLSIIELFDGRLYEMTRAKGKKYPFFSGPDDDYAVGGVLYWKYFDDNRRHRQKKVKKIYKLLNKIDVLKMDTLSNEVYELDAVRDVMGSLLMNASDSESLPPIFDGARVPSERLEECIREIKKLESKYLVSLPLRVNVLDETLFIRTPLNLSKVTDKQKMIKLISDFASVIDLCGGDFVYDACEGRVKATAGYNLLDDRTKTLYQEIRKVFDPYSTLNPGVKQPISFKELVDMLRSSYNVADRAHLVPTT